jgi:hypothetical protein
MALTIPMDLFLISAVCITLLIAAIVIMLSGQRLKRRINAMPLSSDDAIWAKVEQRMAAGEVNVMRGTDNHLDDLATMRADRSLLQDENQVLRDELERIRRELEGRS